MEFKPPISVSFAWDYSDNENVKPIIEQLKKYLSRDIDKPFSRGLEVPLFFFVSLENEAPLNFPKTEAEKNLVIIFTSLNTVSNDDWNSYLIELNKNKDFLLIPIALDKHGLKHSEKLDGVNFLRRYDWPNENLNLHTVLYVLHEIFRFGFNYQTEHKHGLESSIKIFLSHAKSDASAISISKSIKSFLDSTNLNQFFDTSSISPGFSFEKEIREHLVNSTLLAILTDNYSSRYWCQKEIITAKDLDRPVVILNALEVYEDRCFPELSNCPVVHTHFQHEITTDDILVCLITCMVESLRQMHTYENLQNYQKCGWLDADAQILTKPIDYKKAIINLDKGINKYCYPDPPLYYDELSWLKQLGISAFTPLWNEDKRYSLHGLKIGISISETSDVNCQGVESSLPDDILIKLSQEIARQFITRSAALLYAGDLRPGGYTEFILNEALILKSKERDLDCTIENHLAWPLQLMQPEEVKVWLAQYFGLVKFKKHSPPPCLGIDSNVPIYPTTIENKFIWSRCLTEMRKITIDKSDVRVCAGGKRSGYKGAMPGVLEEVLLSIRKRLPIYLFGGFGGIVQDICELIQNNVVRDTLTEEWQAQHNDGYEELQLYSERNGKKACYKNIIEEISNVSLKQLAADAFLTEKEYAKLMTTTFIDEANYICLKGLENMKKVSADD